MLSNNKVGEIVKIIWDEEEDSIQVVMEITDPIYKKKILHSKELQDIIAFEGKNVMIVASKSKRNKNATI